jgi:hypothetical protein
MILNIEQILIHENYYIAENSPSLDLYAEGICLKSAGLQTVLIDGLSLSLRANA